MKRVQIFNRIFRKFKFLKLKDGKNVRTKNLHLKFPYLKNRTYSFHGKEFIFLNKSLRFDDNFLNQSIKYEKLWRYNLYYFDFLNSKDSMKFNDQKKEIINLFITKYQKNIKHEFYDPYPLSLRIVNLIKWVVNEKINDDRITNFIYFQTEILKQKIEYHLLCNHYFSNLKALSFSSIFFDQYKNNSFSKKVHEELDSQLDEQFFLDGGHFEGSPMYHSIIVEDLLDIHNLYSSIEGDCSNIDDINSKLRDIISLSIGWLEKMTHPNKEISFFNDSSLGISLSIDDINTYAESLNIKSIQEEKYLEKNNVLLNGKESGYAVCKNQNFYIIFDTADIGPSYNPGHCHADSLSFELSSFGHKIFVNRGTSTYENSEERNLIRSTISHNTVVIDDRNSSDVWSSFRVGKRAKIIDRDCKKQDQKIIMTGQHDGYSRFLNPVFHERMISFDMDIIEIYDQVRGSIDKSQSIFLLHPDIDVHRIDLQTLELTFFMRKLLLISENNVEINPAKYSPMFNVDLDTKRLLVNFENNNKTTLKIIS